MSAQYTRLLDRLLRVFMHVEFKTDRREVVDYSIVLLVEVNGEMETVRLYDGAHGENELHRYNRGGGKQPAEVVITEALERECAPRSRRSNTVMRL
ncbi:MAG: hypothetical protein ACHQE6_08980 [Solirubrobacterales bacterium]